MSKPTAAAAWQRRTGALIVLTLAAFAGGAGAAEPRADGAFAVANVHFEQNATDGDVEVVFEVKAGDDGLAELTVTAPDGRRVVAFHAPDPSTLGIRQFRFESPEPQDPASLKASYPEGIYEFSGRTFSGTRFDGRSKLNHRLPPTATFITPAPDSRSVNVNDLKISWRPVPGVAHYLVEIKHKGGEMNFATRLPDAITSFTVPESFLAPAQEYTLAIGTITAEGNISVVETIFRSGP